MPAKTTYLQPTQPPSITTPYPSKNSSLAPLICAALTARTMQLQCTLQDGHIMLTSDSGMIEIEPEVWHGSWREGDA